MPENVKSMQLVNITSVRDHGASFDAHTPVDYNTYSIVKKLEYGQPTDEDVVICSKEDLVFKAKLEEAIDEIRRRKKGY